MARALAMHVWCSHDSLSAPDHAMPMRRKAGCGYRGDGPCARFGRLDDSVRPRERNVITFRGAGRVLAMHVWCSHHSLSAPDHAIPMRISWGWSMRTIWTPQRQRAASWLGCQISCPQVVPGGSDNICTYGVLVPVPTFQPVRAAPPPHDNYNFS